MEIPRTWNRIWHQMWPLRTILKYTLICICFINLYKMAAIFLAKREKSHYSMISSEKVIELEGIRSIRSSEVVHVYLKWILSPASLPIRDSSGQYAIHPFVWAGDQWPSMMDTKPSVTLASHCTVDKLHHVVELSKHWDGFISISVFTPGRDTRVADAMIRYMRICNAKLRNRVSFHIVYPIPNPSLEVAESLDIFNDYLDCDNHAKVNSILQQMQDNKRDYYHRVRYPQNHMRNVARSASPTTHCFTGDVDMVPSEGMSAKIDQLLEDVNPCDTCAFVLPTYEISYETPFPPKTKKNLFVLLEQKLAQQFHMGVYKKNQGNSKLELWEKGYGDDSKIGVMYDLKTYEEFWEPVLILHATAPPFEERFVGYGFTRSSHVYLLSQGGFTFSVLDEAFLSHQGFQKSDNYPEYRKLQVDVNREIYKVFREEINMRYKPRPPPKKKPSDGQLWTPATPVAGPGAAPPAPPVANNLIAVPPRSVKYPPKFG